VLSQPPAEAVRQTQHVGERSKTMPEMSLKASEIDEPRVLIERVTYRTERLLDRLDDKDDPVAFVRLMAGHNKTDLRRALDLIDADDG
jgi:hypothetical protein